VCIPEPLCANHASPRPPRAPIVAADAERRRNARRSSIGGAIRVERCPKRTKTQWGYSRGVACGPISRWRPAQPPAKKQPTPAPSSFLPPLVVTPSHSCEMRFHDTTISAGFSSHVADSPPVAVWSRCPVAARLPGRILCTVHAPLPPWTPAPTPNSGPLATLFADELSPPPPHPPDPLVRCPSSDPATLNIPRAPTCLSPDDPEHCFALFLEPLVRLLLTIFFSCPGADPAGWLLPGSPWGTTTSPSLPM